MALTISYLWQKCCKNEMSYFHEFISSEVVRQKRQSKQSRNAALPWESCINLPRCLIRSLPFCWGHLHTCIHTCTPYSPPPSTNELIGSDNTCNLHVFTLYQGCSYMYGGRKPTTHDFCPAKKKKKRGSIIAQYVLKMILSASESLSGHCPWTPSHWRCASFAYHY